MATSLPHPEKILRSSGKEGTANALSMRFGNKYEQAAPNGLNANADNWEVTWAGLTLAEKDTVETALRFNGTWGLFTWTPNYESVSKKFRRVGNYKLTSVNNNIFNISCTLEQRFEVTG